jgi:hypothetical protein
MTSRKMSFPLAVLGFVLLSLFVGLVVIPRLRKGREKSFDAVVMFESVRFWFQHLFKAVF